MQINNRSIQDMHIFGDPSHIPVLIVERVMNAPRRSSSENSYLRHLDVTNSPGLLDESGSEGADKLTGSNKPKTGRVLKIVVFVHGFQASLIIQIQFLKNIEFYIANKKFV